MQSDSENELRVVTENLQAKQRHLEGLIAVKDDEVMTMRRELQMRELELKNYALVESSLKQEIKGLVQTRMQLED